jgi:hypothetical protein
VNATNNSADSWLYLNVSYSDGDVTGLDESSLRMWKHNGTNWSQIPSPNGVETSLNYVYSNITSFSIFAPLGTIAETTPPSITVYTPQSTTYTSDSVDLKQQL